MAFSRKTIVRMIVVILVVLLIVGLGIAIAVSSNRNVDKSNIDKNNLDDKNVVSGWKAEIMPGNELYDSLVEQQRKLNRDLGENDSAEVATCRNMNMYVSQSMYRRMLGLENNADAPSESGTVQTQVKQEWPVGESVKCYMVVDNACYLYSDTATCVSSGEKKYVEGGQENYQPNVLYKSLTRG